MPVWGEIYKGYPLEPVRDAVQCRPRLHGTLRRVYLCHTGTLNHFRSTSPPSGANGPRGRRKCWLQCLSAQIDATAVETVPEDNQLLATKRP